MNCSKENCPMTLAVNMISGKWKLFILYGLRDGAKRYSELQRICEGVTEKMLTSQLRDLERNELIKRKVYPQVPPKVEYSLTEMGQRLSVIFDPLYDWGLNYIRELKPEQYPLIEAFHQTVEQS